MLQRHKTAFVYIKGASVGVTSGHLSSTRMHEINNVKINEKKSVFSLRYPSHVSVGGNPLVAVLATDMIAPPNSGKQLTLRRLMSYIYIYIWSTNS